MVAPDGAGPWPQITSVRPRLISCTMIGTSPPGPFKCGSTTCSVNAVATPASKALPPFCRVAIPTADAIRWVDVTTPKVPSISGRVVNGSGLILLIGIHGCAAWRAHLTTAGAACQPAPGAGLLPSLWACGGCGGGRVIGGMAGDAADQRGGLLAAQIERQRAARVEGAAGWRIDRIGDFALARNPVAGGHRKMGHRPQQHLGVGHARMAEQFAHFRDLDDAAEIHHADPAGHVPDHREVVADEEIGEAELVLQVAHQIEDLRLHGYIERRGRLVADDELGLRGERAR